MAVTEDPRFLPERELSFDATRGWAGGWGTALGLRQRDYMTGDVRSYSFTGEKYFADYRVAYRLDHSRQSGADSALTHALTLTWYPSDKRSLGVTLGAGEEIEIMESFLGEIIYQSRLKLGMTQDQYGAKYDVSGPAVFKFEKGFVRPWPTIRSKK